jgi:hypothetical protein
VFQGKRGDNRATLVPLGLSYRRALSAGTGAIPYAGAGVNLYFVDLRVPADNVDSGIRTAGGGSLFVGSTFGETCTSSPISVRLQGPRASTVRLQPAGRLPLLRTQGRAVAPAPPHLALMNNHLLAAVSSALGRHDIHTVVEVG